MPTPLIIAVAHGLAPVQVLFTEGVSTKSRDSTELLIRSRQYFAQVAACTLARAFLQRKPQRMCRVVSCRLSSLLHLLVKRG